MRIPRSLVATNIGREDRLVRGCIALSLMALGGFSMVGAPQVSLVSILFLMLGLYFAITAAFASDPGYGFAGIDTRTDIELAEARHVREMATRDEVDDFVTAEPTTDHTTESDQTPEPVSDQDAEPLPSSDSPAVLSPADELELADPEPAEAEAAVEVAAGRRADAA